MNIGMQARIDLEGEFFKEGVDSEMIRLLDRVEQMVSKAFGAGIRLAQQGGLADAELWSNNACLGYAIMGANALRYPEEQTKKLVRAIYSEFDWKTVEEAKAVYNKSPF